MSSGVFSLLEYPVVFSVYWNIYLQILLANAYTILKLEESLRTIVLDIIKKKKTLGRCLMRNIQLLY